ncbi:macrolide phosphotransferase [Streptomyces sp. NBRC 110611]|nr:macrolide phosphotransferase [Streptomyces sp. NBRC 110611]
MVAVPQAVDQFANAEMLESLGVARHVPKEQATPHTLRAAALALLADPDVPLRATRIRQSMTTEGGTPHAADLIEAELLPRVPSLPEC